MPEPAVRPELPPQDLRDRSEGWGIFGRIYSYPNYGDDGEWPATVEGHELVDEHTETSDERDSGWWRDGEVLD